jgi:hypothetical protein
MMDFPEYAVPKPKDVVETRIWELHGRPFLHVMAYRYPGPKGERGYEAACLELALFSYGDSPSEALAGLNALCVAYFENADEKQILADAANSGMEKF